MYINFNVTRQYGIKVSNNLSVSKIQVNKSILCIIYVHGYGSDRAKGISICRPCTCVNVGCLL